jgi:dTMP kinase
LFITIEGIEGGGKTTQVGLLAAALERAKLAKEVRALLLHSSTSIGRLAELFLILADRAEHVESLIRPALRAGEVVLCDRFADSTLAYQAYGRDLPLDAVRTVESVARQGLLPDLTFVLDWPIEIGLARTRSRRGRAAADRFEGESTSFHERVRQGFLALAREDPRRIRVIDGTRATDAVHREIFAVSAERLGARAP